MTASLLFAGLLIGLAVAAFDWLSSTMGRASHPVAGGVLWLIAVPGTLYMAQREGGWPLCLAAALVATVLSALLRWHATAPRAPQPSTD